MNQSSLINQNSSEVEYYTPPAIIEAARCAMGRIDLDPASSTRANKIVKADKIFTIHQDGIERDWFGNVWLNHPFGRPEPACLPDCEKKHAHHDYDLHGNAPWIKKLCEQYSDTAIDQACCITYACTSESWFSPLLARPQCFLSPRTNYLLPDGTTKKGVTKGSCVTYFGTKTESFARAFCALGVVKVPHVYF
jgi:DNA N-6-adenine-methyltransferase (Dam)